MVQILVGALNVWLDEYEALIVVHLTLGTLLWGHVFGIVFQLYRVPARVARAGARGRGGDRLMEAGATQRGRARLALRPVVSDYFEMTKPKVQTLLLFTTVTTMYVAGDPSLGLVALTCLGGALSAGGAGAINHCVRPRPRPADGAHGRPAGRLRAGLAARGADLRHRCWASPRSCCSRWP